jgi:uncharacterized membrane protein
MALPLPTRYHRLMGWHAPAVRRLLVVGSAGIAIGALVALFLPWQLALLGGWNGTAVAFLATVLPIVAKADGPSTKRLAVREDVNRDIARLLLLLACGASLAAVAFALGLAQHESGGERAMLVTMAVVTVVVSWTVVNTVFTLRYARLYYGAAGGDSAGGDSAGGDSVGRDRVDFGQPAAAPPDYRDFAYLAFTIGMTYQVSDTTLRDRRIRRAVLVHALISYVFGVVIVAAGVNVVAGLLG